MSADLRTIPCGEQEIVGSGSWVVAAATEVAAGARAIFLSWMTELVSMAEAEIRGRLRAKPRR